jgi:DNA-directed RNA polymerase subunit RPC12/RpoP
MFCYVYNVYYVSETKLTIWRDNDNFQVVYPYKFKFVSNKEMSPLSDTISIFSPKTHFVRKCYITFERITLLKTLYSIIQCYSCGNLLLSMDGQKTKQCPYCNVRLKVSKVKILAHVESATDASRTIIALKQKRHS